MRIEDFNILIKDLQAYPKECEWVEFKKDNSRPDELGEYISALSNSACLSNQKFGYLIFGIEDSTHRIIGTSFSPKEEKIKKTIHNR